MQKLSTKAQTKCNKAHFNPSFLTLLGSSKEKALVTFPKKNPDIGLPAKFHYK